MNAVLRDVLLDFSRLKASFLPIHSALPPCPTLQSVRRKGGIGTTLLAAFWRLFAQLEGTFSSVLHNLGEGGKEGAEIVECGRGIAAAENGRRNDATFAFTYPYAPRLAPCLDFRCFSALHQAEVEAAVPYFIVPEDRVEYPTPKLAALKSKLKEIGPSCLGFLWCLYLARWLGHDSVYLHPSIVLPPFPLFPLARSIVPSPMCHSP